ncbi:HAL protein kinase Oca2 [Schizosaccharomyces octosporus yFS286]|uniref:non-specific serine/threonine protein kinase n=1 Tax=Schizosaccharomyces octosporus (strain yFS286) TaxID=483514 RepID=S9RD15_SCHOY|nr:HAL protein kinase Oca2 [Schizosaccharomyces octosporus yFS286]EPX71989.1 HAL protein kinase Oca2 [Schizosaccharomyces octosporus yFS286]
MVTACNMSELHSSPKFSFQDNQSQDDSSPLEKTFQDKVHIEETPKYPFERDATPLPHEDVEHSHEPSHPLPRVRSPIQVNDYVDHKLAEDRYRSSAAKNFEPISIPNSQIPSEDEDEDDHISSQASTAFRSKDNTSSIHPLYKFDLPSNEEDSDDHHQESKPSSPSVLKTVRGFPSSEDLIGDPNDPYRRTRRAPSKSDPREIPSQFIFKKPDHKHHHSSHHHHGNHSNSSSLSLKSLLHSHDKHDKSDKHEKHHSSLDLRRFFKSHQKSDKKGVSKSRSSSNIQDDHFGLFKKYGKFGRILGSGAGGSVRIMKRSSDGKIFAVKEFRSRRPSESEREYARKVTAEFCVGSALHHTNIIETLDIIEENKKFFEVMEYAPYDMFSIVMSGQMTLPEIYCCFKQLLSGVAYLHSMGLAHRDLKLDNLVVDENCNIKIIDFGSAVVYKYPFEADIVEATGVVGSDPYLAPETLTKKLYDPRAVDIWSCAIIYCCMALRRFPWKYPKLSDNSFRLFCIIPPTKGDFSEEEVLKSIKDRGLVDPGHPSYKPPNTQQRSEHQVHAGGKQEVYGPWRLLRLLPRDTRAAVLHMLDLDPVRRYDIHSVFADDWIANISMCHMQNNKVIRSPTHLHNLVSPEGSPYPHVKR